MKKLAAALLAAALLVLPAQAVSGAPTVDAAAAVLMEKETERPRQAGARQRHQSHDAAAGAGGH